MKTSHPRQQRFLRGNGRLQGGGREGAAGARYEKVRDPQKVGLLLDSL